MRNDTVTAIRSPSNTNLPSHVVAFEVSKHQLVVHTLPADQQRVIPNTPKAIRRVLTAEIKRKATRLRPTDASGAAAMRWR